MWPAIYGEYISVRILLEREEPTIEGKKSGGYFPACSMMTGVVKKRCRRRSSRDGYAEN